MPGVDLTPGTVLGIPAGGSAAQALSFSTVGGDGAKNQNPSGVWTYSPYTGGTASTTAFPIINRAYIVPFLAYGPRQITALGITVFVAADAGNVWRLGVFGGGDLGSANIGNVLGQGTVVADSTGSKTLTFGSPPTVDGLFWVAVGPQGSGGPGSARMNMINTMFLPSWYENAAGYVGYFDPGWDAFFAATGSFADSPSITTETYGRTPYVAVRWA